MSESLFKRIAAIQPKLVGWCPLPKANMLAACVLALRPEVVVEIGVFGGSSFIPMAMALQEVGRGTAIGIDPWNNQAASENYEGADKKYWGEEVDLQKVYSDFTDNITALGLNNCVKIFRLPSKMVVPPPSIDIFHCDGNHSDVASEDVAKFGPRIRVGGICVMDDVDGSFGGGALRAANKLPGMGFIKLFTTGKSAIFQRIK